MRRNSKELLSSFRITIPGGCTGSMNTHRFSPIEDLGKFHSLIHVPTNFRLELALDDLAPQVIEELKHELMTRKIIHFSLFKLKNALKKPLDWITYYPKQIVGYLGALSSAVIVMVIAIPILYTSSASAGRSTHPRNVIVWPSLKMLPEEIDQPWVAHCHWIRLKGGSTSTSLISLPELTPKPESTESIPRPPPDYVMSIMRSNL